MLTNLDKTPFVYFGGKTDAAQWFKAGFLKGGMKQGSSAGHQQHRERLWISPHCLGASESQQRGLFDEKKSTPEMDVVHES